MIEPAWAATLLAGAVAAHNVEEAWWLEAWGRPPGPARGVTPGAFRFAAGGVAVLASTPALALWAGWPAEGVLAGVAGAMVVNAVTPHLALTLWTRRLQPGTATAWLLVVPAAALSLRAVGPVGEVKLGQAFAAATLLGASVPALLMLGRRRENRCGPRQHR